MTNLEMIGKFIEAFGELKSYSTFNTIARRSLDAEFSISKLEQKHHVSYKAYITACTSPASPFRLTSDYDNEQLNRFIKALKEYQGRNKALDKIMNKEDNKKELGALMASLLQNKEDITMEEEGVVKVASNSLSAGIKFEVDVAGILKKAAEQYLESDAAGILTHVDKRIMEEASKLRPNAITIGTKEPVEIKGKLHIRFKELVETLTYEKQAFLVGPAGTGKTTLASQVATAFKVDFGHISCTAGMSEAHLMGRMVADGSYIPSEFITLYENGGVFLFDEIDAADPNTLLIVNSALANGYMSVPNRKDKPKAVRHKEFYAVCAANTWGQGSNQYAGRSILDAAFLDRFVMGKIEVGYDKNLEGEILRSNTAMADRLWKIRQNIETSKLRRVLSTRAFVSSAIGLGAGKTPTQILERYFTGWSKEERIKAMQGV